MRKVLYLVAIIVILLVGCTAKTIENRVNWSIEDFEFTDHNGEPFSLSDMEGKVWVANFIFTNCNTVCPPITANMARIQKMIEQNDWEDVELVSFSIDPEIDKPEVLKSFASKFTDNLDNWHFLTGYVQKYIEQFAKDNFKFYVYKPENEEQVNHGTDMFLIDEKGTVVKYYSAIDVPYDVLKSDIEVLLDEK